MEVSWEGRIVANEVITQPRPRAAKILCLEETRLNYQATLGNSRGNRPEVVDEHRLVNGRAIPVEESRHTASHRR